VTVTCGCRWAKGDASQARIRERVAGPLGLRQLQSVVLGRQLGYAPLEDVSIFNHLTLWRGERGQPASHIPCRLLSAGSLHTPLHPHLAPKRIQWNTSAARGLAASSRPFRLS
jgi:hypothetical protein